MKQSQFKFSKPVIDQIEYNVKSKCDISKLSGRQISFGTNTEIELSEDEKKAIVKLIIQVFDTEDFPFIINMTMSTKVSWEDDIPDNMRDSILNNNVPATILSYARPIISMITSYSHYKSFDIPFLDFRDNN